MQITPNNLFQILPYTELKKLGLTVSAAVGLTRRFYCSQMTMNDLCITDCNACAARLLRATSNLETASKPTGLFAANLRRQVADAVEEVDNQKKPEVQRNRFGEKDDTVDLYAELEAGLS
jgi:hypothetical protein